MLARLLADEVATIPPDPARDTRLIDALLGASALDGNHELAEAQEAAFSEAETTGEHAVMGAVAPGQMMAMAAAPMAPRAAPPPQAPSRVRASDARKEEAAFEGGALDEDAKRRASVAPMYRAVDRTQEWAETNWWKRTPAESRAAMIAPNRLWRDLALHARGTAKLLSPHFGLATNSFAEAMCALAVIDVRSSPARTRSSPMARA